MEKFETQQQVLKNEQQYYGIARITGSRNITGFVCALGQYLRGYIAPNIKFSYKWVRLSDGTLYFAIVGSRAVQDVFERYLTINQGDYFDRTSFVSYGRNDKAFNRVFDEYFIQRQLPNGFASGGSHP
ncbi:hypothetical protein PsexTeo8_21120 [Pseudomonas extremaustralis]|uniref:hypothetical protein n=1 Tax=Pseudomonas extremaustralis TaxID=359110 RepID=UPI002AA0D630|nr:hypothetical protein [Pseudomonas extremaustralis]MDY7065667.1 hypothetical protein [Pseudomonas extremaustralis]